MREQREIIAAERYDVVTVGVISWRLKSAMIKRTIAGLEGASHSSMEERVEAILELADTICLKMISASDIEGKFDKGSYRLLVCT